MVTKKTWDDFRSTGLVLFINQILHAFGWAIVFEIDDESKKITDVFPARVKFRGFDNDSVSESYKKITEYISDSHKELLDDVNS